MASMFTLNSGMLLKNNERWGDDIDNRQQEGQVVWSEEKLRKIQNIEADDLVKSGQGIKDIILIQLWHCGIGCWVMDS